NNLAGLYQARGCYDQAEPLYKKALQGRRAKLGADHPNTLASMHCLAGLYQAQGCYDEAEKLFQQALEGRRAKLGANHPDTLISLKNLAGLYQARGRLDAAEPLFREAVAGARETKSLEQLVELYDAWGKKDEAAKWRKELKAV